uniref:Uncharacterized protein n=1 Tax=Megaselia scalaris TaxID=36166 RepID=T1GZH5_MEGSC
IRRERRPDRAVYVPRARRSLTTPPQVTNTLDPLITAPTTNGDISLKPRKVKSEKVSTKSQYSDENVNLVNMSTKTNMSTTPKAEVLRIDGGATNNIKDNDSDLVELKRASNEINRSNRRIIKQTFVSDVLEIPDIQSSDSPNDSVSCDPETDDWDTMFDDNGECLDPKIIEELSASVGKVKIETPKMDYT